MVHVTIDGDQIVQIEPEHDLDIVFMIEWLWFESIMIGWPKLILDLIWTRAPSETLF